MGQKKTKPIDYDYFPTKFSTLTPLAFHETYGSNIVLYKNNQEAERRWHHNNGILFSDRPIESEERVCLRIIQTDKKWNGALRFGVTNIDPKCLAGQLPQFVIPDLTNKNGFWAGEMPIEDCEKSDVKELLFHFYVTSDHGYIYYGYNGRTMKKLTGPIVDTTKPLWAMIDLFGIPVRIELVNVYAEKPKCVQEETHDQVPSAPQDEPPPYSECK